MKHMENVYKELFHIYLCLKECHEISDTDITLPSLQAYFFQRFPDADKESYLGLFKTLSETSLDPNIGVAMLKQLKARKTAHRLSEQAFRFSTGLVELTAVEKAIQEFSSAPAESDSLDGEDTNLGNILTSAILDPGLRWRLDCFNKSLGSLRPGDFGFLFKRPEAGGTAMCASEVSFMLDQTDSPIIWINNEEQSNKVILRVYQAYFGVSLATILANPRKYETLFAEKVGNKFKMFGHEFSNKQAIERIVRKHNPALMIYDQLDGIKGFEADRNDLVLGEIYKWVRDLSRQGHAALGITQADGTADGQKWLTMQHVSEAKTTKQAAADFIIGMGHSFSEGAEYIRYINLSKNKLAGDSDTLPHLRHGRFEVLLQSDIMRFKDIVEYR